MFVCRLLVTVGSCATPSAETSNSHFLVLHLDTAQKRLALDCARAASYCLFRRHRKKAESSVSATASPVFGSSASAWRDGHGATMTGQRPAVSVLRPSDVMSTVSTSSARTFGACTHHHHFQWWWWKQAGFCSYRRFLFNIYIFFIPAHYHDTFVRPCHTWSYVIILCSSPLCHESI